MSAQTKPNYDALEVDCPHCKAEGGYYCVATDGHALAWETVHEARQRAVDQVNRNYEARKLTEAGNEIVIDLTDRDGDRLHAISLATLRQLLVVTEGTGSFVLTPDTADALADDLKEWVASVRRWTPPTE